MADYVEFKHLNKRPPILKALLSLRQIFPMLEINWKLAAELTPDRNVKCEHTEKYPLSLRNSTPC